ncbi:UDP-N-acetylmuramoyl-tripeptide--D-alanyl-D-alanine ligase [Aquibacillus kalidii]|uniref:UDP-N-acetylmuramoyl-tripeptide--D-alanyl-D- alanine ligase n=1 Tax=Aquibacillus kalidii TaxID=2762597 RepID=UPI001C99E58C|nr:UDP-N-acetylmuramoyl-tripeptide--D-alanyl-D-alanine ligase [Aquibacillus kalidii]
MITGLLIILTIVWSVFLFLKGKTAIHMLQLNSYRNERLFRWAKENLRKVFQIKEIIALVAFIPLLFGSEIVGIVTLIVLYGLTLWLRKPVQEKKKLAVTARVKRQIITLSIIFILVLAAIAHMIYHDWPIGGILLLMVLTHLLAYAIVVVANLINAPIENGIKEHYYKDAKRIIDSASQLKTIGITGSYGKTSTKFILDTILSSHYNTLKTPESYNTKIGVTITIRNFLKPYHDVFIAEMGAKEPGNIQEICELVSHKYAILTAIGEQHLETFKSLDNIKKTKYEIVETLPSDGVAFLNKDDENIMSYTPKNDCKKVYYGIDADDADYQATDIKYHNKGTTFTVVNKAKDISATFETKLLGKHNVYNILSAIAVAFELGVPEKNMMMGVKKIAPVPHRMEVRKGFGGLSVIDDSFNSNPKGSKLALDVLGTMDGYKVLVTPGMIELGDKQYDYNKQFGEYAADVCDYVILVGEKQTKPIKDGLEAKGYPTEKTYVAKHLNDAIGHMQTIKRSDAIVLLENDLPDTFNE